MLDKVGIANQTTMLKGETQAIGKLYEKTMMQKFGPENLKEHFMVMDTICDATQERQDAMYELTDGSQPVDIMLVVGGFNSSNTSHLQEIAEHKGIPSFWVCNEECIDVAANKVRAAPGPPYPDRPPFVRSFGTLRSCCGRSVYRLLRGPQDRGCLVEVLMAGACVQVQHKTSWGELKETEGWLTPGKPLRLGVTSGASTPDNDVETCLDRMFAIMHPEYEGIAPLAEAVEVVAPAH